MRGPPLTALLVVLAAAASWGPWSETGYDFDRDGVEDARHRGPRDASIHSRAADPQADGVDQDCHGADGVDGAKSD